MESEFDEKIEIITVFIMKKVFFVIVNYNGKEVLKECLRSVFVSEKVAFEVVVVDNASKDESLTEAKQLFPKAQYIAHKENKGFAGGSNSGIKFALEHGAEYVFLLNNDAVVEKDTIALLLQYAEKDRKNIFSPLVLSSRNPRKVWFCGGHIDWFRMRALHQKCTKEIKEPTRTEYLSGCALLIPKQAFYEVGLLDEEYFLYYEDADWSVRARQAGYALWVIPGAEVVHTEQSEKRNSLKVYFLVLSGLIFFQKNTSGLIKWWGYGYLFLRVCKNSFDRFFHLGDPLVTNNVSNAYADFRNKTPLRYYRSLRER